MMECTFSHDIDTKCISYNSSRLVPDRSWMYKLKFKLKSDKLEAKFSYDGNFRKKLEIMISYGNFW